MHHELEIETPYLVFLGDAKDALAAKTGFGIVDWRPEQCVGQMRFADCHADLGIDDLDVEQAAAAGARTLVIGTVSPGGGIPDDWLPVLRTAIDAGLNIASGMHTRLTSLPELAVAAEARGVRLHDVRHADVALHVGQGTPRPGKRVLTVGTDCSIGKKYTALALEREMLGRGMDATFRATGQTGILIAGGGIAVDAVIADFISGAVELLSPAADERHWDVIEGQGSLFHPSFAGVTLGLLHGAQPDAFVVCHEPTRQTMRNVPAPMPTVAEVIELTVRCGRITNPAIRCVGIAVNTAALPMDRARQYLAETTAEHRLPATDPIRYGVSEIVDHLLDETA